MLQGGNKPCLWSPIRHTSTEVRLHSVSVHGGKKNISDFCFNSNSRILQCDSYSAV